MSRENLRPALLKLSNRNWSYSYRDDRGPGPEVIQLFSCSTQLRLKLILPINVKMPKIVDILTFISTISFCLKGLKPECSTDFGCFKTRGSCDMAHLTCLIKCAASWENQQCGFRTGPTQTGLHKHRKELEALNIGFK